MITPRYEIVSISPHGTELGGMGKIEGASKLVVERTTLVDASRSVCENFGVNFIKFKRSLKVDEFVIAFGLLILEAITENPNLPLLILAPAMLSVIDDSEWRQVRRELQSMLRKKEVYVVAFVSTEATSRSRPAEKVARSDEFSLIVHLNVV